jgi:hypothetical protein
MGCGESLFLAGDTGRVICSLPGCPNPRAVDQILADPETEHLVDFTDTGFAILHPLRERLGGLWACGLNRALTTTDGPPTKPGRYRARPVGSGPAVATWTYEEVKP